MTYEDFVTKISELSGQPKDTVKDILFYIPDVLIMMAENDMVRTPLGVFKMTHRSSRNILPPNGTDPVLVPEEMVVKMRSGKRLRKAI